MNCSVLIGQLILIIHSTWGGEKSLFSFFRFCFLFFFVCLNTIISVCLFYQYCWQRAAPHRSCACPPHRLQRRALALLQLDRSVPASAQHLHQQQQHIRRNGYDSGEPCRARERAAETRETPSAPTACSAPKQTLKVRSR